MYSQPFFKLPTTIEYAPLANTCGYDIHYALAPEEKAEDTLRLQNRIANFIVDYQSDHPNAPIYLSRGNVTKKPVGPWENRMWEIQISTASDITQPYDPNVVAPSKIKMMHDLMLSIGEFAKQQVNPLQLKGTLIIHANGWPMNANMVDERSMHFDTSWHVFGPKVAFKDIWTTLIAIEKHLTKQLEQADDEWHESESYLAALKDNLRATFKGNTAYPAENGELDRAINFIIEGQHNLHRMQKSSQAQDSFDKALDYQP